MKDRTKDIDSANTWVISDTHFGHENIVGFCFRPEDHEQVMLAQWRAVVPDDATIIHLGDVSYGHNGGNTRFRRLTSKELTGERKILIRGNHDNQNFSFYRDSGFRVWEPFSIEYSTPQEGRWREAGYPEKHTVSFSHYPWGENDGEMRPWDWRLHGHIHNNGYTRDAYVPFLRNHINVSVEQLRYTPVNLKLLLDAAILGKYPASTPEQIADARQRRESRRGR